jgi:hypothetical protein
LYTRRENLSCQNRRTNGQTNGENEDRKSKIILMTEKKIIWWLIWFREIAWTSRARHFQRNKFDQKTIFRREHESGKKIMRSFLSRFIPVKRPVYYSRWVPGFFFLCFWTWNNFKNFDLQNFLASQSRVWVWHTLAVKCNFLSQKNVFAQNQKKKKFWNFEILEKKKKNFQELNRKISFWYKTATLIIYGHN